MSRRFTSLTARTAYAHAHGIGIVGTRERERRRDSPPAQIVISLRNRRVFDSFGIRPGCQRERDLPAGTYVVSIASSGEISYSLLGQSS